MMRTVVIVFVLFLSSNAYDRYKDEIPNGSLVPDPCSPGNYLSRVGHSEPSGRALNKFGEDFENEGTEWTPYLCHLDSDGDGQSNGEELGDPSCLWSKGNNPEFNAKGHPGVCQPFNSTKCINKANPCS